MKIVVFGAAGQVGQRISEEALRRGHPVTGVVRTANKLRELPCGVSGLVLDAQDKEKAGAVLADQDLAVSALRPPDGREDELPRLTKGILQAATWSHTRVFVVGGAANLLLPDGSGHTVLSAPDFLPDTHRAIATACFSQYQVCRSEQKTDWVYFSPPATLVPGIRTGRYQRGVDILLVNKAGQSEISMEDFAVAMLDEAESPTPNVQRITVAN